MFGLFGKKKKKQTAAKQGQASVAAAETNSGGGKTDLSVEGAVDKIREYRRKQKEMLDQV